MKFHVIFLALTLFISGCAFKEKGRPGRSAASALSESGFSGTLSAIVEPSIQAVIPNAISIPNPLNGSFTLQVLGTNLGYRGVPDQPNIITSKPLLMSLGGGCECTSNDINATVLPTNQDSLSCTIPYSSCSTGGVNRTLTITRAVASGDPSTVSTYSAVQILTDVPFQLGSYSVNCTGANGQPLNNQTSNIFCKSTASVTVNMTGGTNLAGGQLRLGNTVCSSLNYNGGTTSFGCTFPAVCSSGSDCTVQSLSIIYSQAGYGFTFGNVNFISPYTITGISPNVGIATELNSIQISGTNLTPNLSLTVFGKTCSTTYNTSTVAECIFSVPFVTTKDQWPSNINFTLTNSSFSMGGAAPGNTVSLPYLVKLNDLSITGIRVRQGVGFQKSRVIASNQSQSPQLFALYGTNLDKVGTSSPVQLMNAAGLPLTPNVTPTCSVINSSEMSCQMNPSNMGAFSGVRAAMFGLKVFGNSSTRDLPTINNVFEVLGKSQSDAEALTDKICNSNADCWVDESQRPINFSDMRPRVWNRYITILFGTMD